MHLIRLHLLGSSTPPARVYFCLPRCLAGSRVSKDVPRRVYLTRARRFSLINLDPERGKLPKAT